MSDTRYTRHTSRHAHVGWSTADRVVVDAILEHSAVKLTRDDARRIARHRHPIALKLLAVVAFGILFAGANDREGLGFWSVATVGGIGLTVFLVSEIRSATVNGLLQGAEEVETRYAVTDHKLVIDSGPVSIARDWDSITSRRLERGLLVLVAPGGRIGIPVAMAPGSLLDAIDAQLRRRGVPDPPASPAFRRTFVVLLALLALLAVIVAVGDGPTDICDENPGLTYWDADGPHTC